MRPGRKAPGVFIFQPAACTMRPVNDRPGAPARLVSLDAFRGLTIAAMILVNNPGDWLYVYWPLLHVPWHGWTPTDLIFPFFLFMVGCRSRSRGGSSSDRPSSAPSKLVGLGLLLSLYPYFHVLEARWPGSPAHRICYSRRGGQALPPPAARPC